MLAFIKMFIKKGASMNIQERKKLNTRVPEPQSFFLWDIEELIYSIIRDNTDSFGIFKPFKIQ